MLALLGAREDHMNLHCLQSVVIGIFVGVATASAQGTPPPTPRVVPEGNMWSHGTTLNVFGGATGASGDRAAIAGGALGWEIRPWFAIEGGGTWLDWGKQAHAFAPSMSAQVGLLTPRPVVPFLTGGIGLYHASFNRLDSAMPAFYRRRMTGMSGMASRITFTDPSLVGGGGLSVFLSRHWTLRPEIVATVVLQDSNTFVVTTGAVRLAYHFEDHPVTP
jgi:hypothetical protein